MLNKENYVPWSFRLLCYAKSRPNGKLIRNSIINVPYVRRMIREPGDTNWEVPVNETFHVQTDDKLTKKELKQIEADDQAIQTILLGLPEDIYAAVDSCEMAQEIWLRVQQMMKGSDIGIQEKKAKLFNEWERFTSNEGESIESYYHRFLKLINDLKRNKHFPKKIASNLKFLNYLQPEWSRHVTIVHQTKDLHTTDYTQLYDFLKYNQKEVDELKAERLAKTQDSLALMVAQNPRVQNVGNQNGLIGVPGNANQNLHGNGNLVVVRAEGNVVGQNGNQIRCYNCRGVGHFARNCTVRPRRRDAAYLQTQLLIAQKEDPGIQLQAEEFDIMAAAADLDEIEEVNANCILMANLQQASTSGTQTDKAPVYDSNGSAEVHDYENCNDNEIFNMFTQEEQYTELLEPILDQHQVPQNDNNVISEEETLQLAQESREKMKQLNKEIKPANYTKINQLSRVFVSQTAKSREEFYFSNDSKTANVLKSISIPNEEFSDDTTPSVARKFLNEEEAKFVGDFKSLAKEADESLAKHKALELEIEHLLKAVVSQDIMSVVQTNSVVDTSNLQTELEHMKERFENRIIKKENEYAKLWNDWYKKCDECKYDKISYDKAYKDMQQKIERLQAQLGDLNGKSKYTLCVSDTLNTLPQKLKNENVELEFQVSVQKENTRATSKNTKFAKQSILGKPPMLSEIHALSKPVTSNYVPTPQESKVVKNDKVIAPEMFRINPFKTSRESNVPNNVRASARTKPITISQPPVFTKKDVNSDSNGLSSTGLDNTKTRRPQPRSNTKNDRVPSASKSSRSKNKEVEVKEHHRNLLLSKNNKHMSSICNNFKLDSQNVVSKVVCAMCKQCSIFINHDVCLRNSMNGKTSHGKKQTANVSIKEKQNKQKPKVKKPKKVGFIERLATPKPSKPRSLLRWSPTGRMFDLNGKIIASNEFKSQSDCSKGDNACTSNPMEPKIKRFPNSTSLLGRLKKDQENDKIGSKRDKNGKRGEAVKERSRKGQNRIKTGQKREAWRSREKVKAVTVERARKNEENKKRMNENAYTVKKLLRIGSQLVLGRAFRRNACFVRNLEGVDLLKGDHSTNLYTINLHEMASASPICLMARASSTKSWLWHQGLSHLKFDTINDLARNDLVSGLPKFNYHKEHICPSYEQGKSKRASHSPEPVPNSRQRLHLLYMDLCGPMRISSINEKRSGLDLTYAPSTITTQQPSEAELDLLFEAMYDDYIGGQPSATARTVTTAQEPQVRQTSTASTSIADTAPTPTNSSSHETNIPITSQDVDELNPNAMVDGNTFVNPFTNPSTSVAESSSSQNVDPSNMHTFYQPYPHEFQWTKDHPLEQVYVDYIIFGSTHLRLTNPPCGIFINQSKYVLEILKKYGMESFDPVGTPMKIKDKLDLDQNGTPVDATKYRSMIGALMYLTSSRLDIVHATCLCARYQAKPIEKHLKEMLIMCKDSFKSTSGGAQFLGEKLTQLTDYGFNFNKIPIYCDSKSAIAISCNPTDYQLADLFTKALPADRFNYLVRRLGMRSLSPHELEHLAKSQ
nr:uncharacterized mitochondrial protein AtMg00810-like [Tanacetum cinerariifolium]